MSNNISGISLSGKQVTLRPIERTDYRVLYSWRVDPCWLYLWSNSRRLVTYEEFIANVEKSWQTNIDMWMLVISKDTESPVGFVYNYDTNIIDGHTFLTMFVAPDSRSQGIGRETGALFVNYLMGYFPFKKLYADVYEFNNVSQLFISNYGFVKEGFFPQHRYFLGGYHGMYRLALYREKWDDLIELFVANRRSISMP